MNIFKSKDNKNQFADTIMSSPKALLSRLINGDSSNIDVTLFDCHGLQHFGCPIKIDQENKYLLLQRAEKGDEESSLSFIDLDSVISVKVHNPKKHLKVLTGKETQKAADLDEDKEIDIDDYVLEVQDILKNNYNIHLDIKLIDTGLSSASKSQQKILIDTVKSILSDIAEDSYSAELISALDSINIVQSDDQHMSIKRRNSTVHIKVDLENRLPSRLPKLIEDGINRIL